MPSLTDIAVIDGTLQAAENEVYPVMQSHSDVLAFECFAMFLQEEASRPF